MNGAKYSLTLIGETPEERHNCPRALRVEARSRFIEEEEKLGLQWSSKHESLLQESAMSVCTLAASSTAIVVLFLCSTLRVPTAALAYSSNPQS